MKILLLNDNPVVSRLVSLSAKKMSYEFEELNAYDENLGYYDVIIVDSDTPAPLKILQTKSERLIFLALRNQELDIDAEILHKPFLPTDFLALLRGDIENEALSLNDENVDSEDLASVNSTVSDELSLNINADEDLENLSLDEESQQVDKQDLEKQDMDLDALSLEEENLEELNVKDENLEGQENLEANSDLEANTSDFLPMLEEEQNEKLEVPNLEEEKLENLEELNLEENSDNQRALNLQENSQENDEQDLKEPKLSAEQNLEEQELSEEEQIQEFTPSVEELDLSEEQGLEELETSENLQTHSLKELGEELNTSLDTQANLENLEDEENLESQESLEDNKALETSESVFDELPMVEEKEMDFDDIPEDAEFLGQAKEEQEPLEDFVPVIEDEQEELENLSSNLSTQEQIMEELAELDELDCACGDGAKVLEEFKDEPILNEEELGVGEEEVVVPTSNDFDTLQESDIQKALGEEVLVEDGDMPKLETRVQNESSSEEIVNELSQSIAGAITSSIKDDTLKAALKGMNMNININISFKED